MSNRTRTASSSASTPSRRIPALITLVITDAGTVEVEPGEGFNESHLDMMTAVTCAVRDAVTKENG